MTIKIKFEGIDSWNRPVFKSTNSAKRFGCVYILFNDDAKEEYILSKITEDDLCYFGQYFGCEPMGTNPWKLDIIRPSDVNMYVDVKIVSVDYSIQLNEDIIKRIMDKDLTWRVTPLYQKLEEIENVRKARYPINNQDDKLSIIIKLTNPKKIKVEDNQELWNMILEIIEQHIKEKK